MEVSLLLNICLVVLNATIDVLHSSLVYYFFLYLQERVLAVLVLLSPQRILPKQMTVMLLLLFDRFQTHIHNSSANL